MGIRLEGFTETERSRLLVATSLSLQHWAFQLDFREKLWLKEEIYS